MKSPAITIASGAAFTMAGTIAAACSLLNRKPSDMNSRFAFDEPLGTQFIKKGQRRRLVSPRGGHDAKTIDAAWFLRRCLVEWPYSRCTANQCEEIAPSHYRPRRLRTGHRSGTNLHRERSHP